MFRIMLLLLALTGALVAEPVPSEVKDAYQSLIHAWTKLDLAGVMDHFSSDAHILDGRGIVLNREGLEKSVEEAMNEGEGCTIDYKILSARRDGEGDLLVRTHQERTIDYGNRLAIRISEREDHWHQTSAGWKIRYVYFITQSSTVESRTVRPRP
jgi:ketosteroid isomerase-like protein